MSVSRFSFIVGLVALAGCGAAVPPSIRAELALTPRGKVTVVEFVDFECPFCRRQHAAAAPALERHAADVRIVRKHVPLSFHPHAEDAARVFLCAEEQGDRVRLEALADALYTAPPAELAAAPASATAARLGADEARLRDCMHDAHITTRLRADGKAFREAEGEGVPLTFVGRTRLDGAVDAETFERALEGELRGLGSAKRPEAARPSALPPTARLTFIEDDYPRALAEAKARHVPLFVDAWAPWCHSCLSMREYTFAESSLAPLAKEFVFLAVDTEKPANAAFVSRFPNEVWPTLYVVDPDSERARVKWGGTATAAELIELLATARPDARGSGAFAQGNQASAAGEADRAEASYREALALAAPGSRDRGRSVEALAGSLSEREKWGECLALVDAELPRLPRGSSRATVLAIAVECADEGKASAEKTSALLSLVRAELAASDANEDGALLADDRSGLWDTLVSAEEKLPEAKDAAKKDAGTWATFLEREARRAKTKEARAVFDAHRLLAYTAAGRESDAIPMLEESLRDFPHDYNPKARLAKVYFDAKDLARARSYVEQAFAEVYGPRTLRVAALAASIAKAQGRPEDAVAFQRAALERTRALPLTKKQRALFTKTERELGSP